MSHTPGPWEYKDGAVSAGERTVALVYSEDGEEHRWWWECGRANARLIAAAPELLAALMEFREWFRAGCPAPVTVGEPICATASLAISKAIGSEAGR